MRLSHRDSRRVRSERVSKPRRESYVSAGGAIAVWPGLRDGGFRIFGYGLSWKDIRVAHEFLSEREHHYVQLRLGSWLLKPLKRGAIGFGRPLGRKVGA